MGEYTLVMLATLFSGGDVIKEDFQASAPMSFESCSQEKTLASAFIEVVEPMVIRTATAAGHEDVTVDVVLECVKVGSM